MATFMVEATRTFRNVQIGSKEAGDQFEYDLAEDPLGLKAEGKVRAVPAVVETAAPPPPASKSSGKTK